MLLDSTKKQTNRKTQIKDIYAPEVIDNT